MCSPIVAAVRKYEPGGFTTARFSRCFLELEASRGRQDLWAGPLRGCVRTGCMLGPYYVPYTLATLASYFLFPEHALIHCSQAGEQRPSRPFLGRLQLWSSTTQISGPTRPPSPVRRPRAVSFEHCRSGRVRRRARHHSTARRDEPPSRDRRVRCWLAINLVRQGETVLGPTNRRQRSRPRFEFSGGWLVGRGYTSTTLCLNLTTTPFQRPSLLPYGLAGLAVHHPHDVPLVTVIISCSFLVAWGPTRIPTIWYPVRSTVRTRANPQASR